MLLLVLSHEVGSIVATLSLLLEREIIGFHLHFEGVVSSDRIPEIVSLLRALVSLGRLSCLLGLV